MSSEKSAKHKRDSDVVLLRDLVPRKTVLGAGKLRLGERPPRHSEEPPATRRTERSRKPRV